MSKKNIVTIATITVCITVLSLSLLSSAINLYTSKNRIVPENSMIHKELIIYNSGKYSNLYTEEINQDRGGQSFGLSVEVKRNDLHVYVLAHKSSEHQVNEFIKWLVSYYGAEEIKGNKGLETTFNHSVDDSPF